MTDFRYFAYGSNMLTARLVARCPGARPLGAAVATDVAVIYGKRSVDESAKLTLVFQPGSVAFGALFEVPDEDRDALDRSEGPGYVPMPVSVVPLHRGFSPQSAWSAPAMSYRVASGWDCSGVPPYHWYKELVMHGADEHALPLSHREGLRRVASVADPRPERPQRRAAIAALTRRGITEIPCPECRSAAVEETP